MHFQQLLTRVNRLNYPSFLDTDHGSGGHYLLYAQTDLQTFGILIHLDHQLEPPHPS